MDSTLSCIDHYVNQVINEECVLELQQLAREYRAELKKLDESSHSRNTGDHDFKRIHGYDNPNSHRNAVKANEAKYQTKAKEIASKHAREEGQELIEWKELGEEKAETVEANDEERIPEAKIKERRILQDQNLTREEKKAQIVAEMQNRSSKTIEIKQEQNNPAPVQKPEEELTKEEKKKQLIEQMRQSSMELSQKRELGK